jgi:hypothetical protein
MSKTPEFVFKVKHEVTRKRVEEVILSLVTAYSPWVAEVSWEKMTKETFHLVAKYTREEDEEGVFKGRKIIMKPTIERGLVAMATIEPERFGNIINDRYDAIDADIFLQCIIFGKTIYG